MLIFVQIIGKVMSLVKRNITLAILNPLKFNLPAVLHLAQAGKINLCLIIMPHAM